jgi:hypothetical protein
VNAKPGTTGFGPAGSGAFAAPSTTSETVTCASSAITHEVSVGASDKRIVLAGGFK